MSEEHHPETPVEAHHPEEHKPHPGGHGAKRGHGGHEGGHGGGHGGSWLVTYCDMITLLMAFFICLLTFASQHTGTQKRPRMGESLLNLLDGEGLAARPREQDLDAVVWRELPVHPAFHASHGSELAPMYSDPRAESTAAILHLLEEVKGTLTDSYILRLPLLLFVGNDGRLTASGAQLLHLFAANLRSLPYDFQLQTNDQQDLKKMLVLVHYLVQTEGLHPSRVGLGVRPEADTAQPSVWITIVRR